MQEALHNCGKRAEAQLLVIGVTSPLKAALYRDGECLESVTLEGKSSEVLPGLLHDILYRYKLKEIYYANGPGSFMAIKVTYVMLKTLSIALDIPLFAADAFTFNGNRPIKAIGKSCFVKKDGEISIVSGCIAEENSFEVPKRLEKSLFTGESEPLYVLPAV